MSILSILSVFSLSCSNSVQDDGALESQTTIYKQSMSYSDSSYQDQAQVQGKAQVSGIHNGAGWATKSDIGGSSYNPRYHDETAADDGRSWTMDTDQANAPLTTSEGVGRVEFDK
ncbi:MAG: hypothetical protein V1650_01715 [Candidatus Omnitrophota bacterium]